MTETQQPNKKNANELAFETSAFELRWPINLINLVDKTKFSFFHSVYLMIKFAQFSLSKDYCQEVHTNGKRFWPIQTNGDSAMN